MLVIETRAPVAVPPVAAWVAADGWNRHPFRALLHEDGTGLAASGSDLVHHLLLLHGDAPGLIEDARDATVPANRPAWLADAADAFAGERAVLMRLAAGCGAIQSTPGQRECEIVMAAQRHAVSVLGRSDRQGCALGAVFALLHDWAAVRETLDLVALRVGLLLPSPVLPRPSTPAEVSPLLARAIGFGAHQLLAQHRGLWSLLEARHRARAG